MRLLSHPVFPGGGFRRRRRPYISTKRLPGSASARIHQKSGMRPSLHLSSVQRWMLGLPRTKYPTRGEKMTA